jgi:hypothetical protein
MSSAWPGDAALHADAIVVTEADACATDRAIREPLKLRRHAQTRYAAKSWGATKRRVVARIEASSLGLNIRFVVTSLAEGSPGRIYDTLYRARARRRAMPKTTALRTAEFAIIRLRLLNVGGRVIETAIRIRIAFASACPDAALFRSLAANLRAGP